MTLFHNQSSLINSSSVHCILQYQLFPESSWHEPMFERGALSGEKARPVAAPAVAAAARHHRHLAGKRPQGAGAHVNEETAAAGTSHSPSPPAHTPPTPNIPFASFLCESSTSHRLPWSRVPSAWPRVLLGGNSLKELLLILSSNLTWLALQETSWLVLFSLSLSANLWLDLAAK